MGQEDRSTTNDKTSSEVKVTIHNKNLLEALMGTSSATENKVSEVNNHKV